MEKARSVSRFQRWVTISAIYPLVGGCASFLGWIFDWPGLTDWNGSGISIQPNAALCAAGTGLAVLALQLDRFRLAAMAAAVVLFFGGGTLFEWLSNIPLGIDSLFLFDREWGRTGVIVPGRMGPPGSLSWTLLGISLLLCALRRGVHIVPGLALATLGISSLSLMGYIYQSDTLYTLPRLTVIAWQTATFIFVSSLALIFRLPRHEPMRTLLDPGSAGILMRRAVPLVVMLPITLGFLRVAGQRAELYDTGMGTALYVVLLIPVLLFVTWGLSSAIRRHEFDSRTRDRQKAFLLALSDALKPLADPASIRQVASRMLGQHLRVHRVIYAEISGKHFHVENGYVQGVEQMTGKFRMEDFGFRPEAALESGQTIVIRDVAQDPRIGEGQRPAYLKAGIAAFIGELLLKDDMLVAAFAVHHATPRDWTREEVDLVKEVAERTWSAIERSRVEELLRVSEQRYRSLVSVLTDVPWSTCPAGQFVSRQPAWEQYTGQTWEEYQGFGWLLALHPDDRDQILEIWQNALRTEQPYRSSGRFWHRASADYRQFEARAVPVFSRSAELTGWVGCCTDVNERFETERALLESETRERNRALLMQTVLETSPAAIWVALDRDCRQLIANAAAEALLGLPLDDFSAGSANHITLAQDGQPLNFDRFPLIQAAREGMTIRSAEMEVVRADGSSCYLLLHASPLLEGNELNGAIAVAVDITNRRRAEQELRDADRKKDEFLAILAHELRNPLAPIRNGLQILRLGTQNLENSESILEMMERQVSHMVRLIDDLLEVSRITRGKIQLRTEPLDLREVIQNARQACAHLFQSHAHRVTFDLPGDPLWVIADAVRLTQVLSNLLNNAAKFTPDSGDIVVTARATEGWVEIVVRDNGIGIPADILPRVFDLFTQVETQLSRAQGGLGIGLSLVKNIVTLHGGTVRASSSGTGMGSEFVIRLPSATQGSIAEFRSASSPARHARPIAPKRVLVVDDNRDAADSLATLLKCYGMEVQTVYDGTLALQTAKECQPALIFLDIGMPQLDGYSLAHEIRSCDQLRSVRLVALTGWGQTTDLERSRQVGFDRHLVKPPDLEAVEEILASL